MKYDLMTIYKASDVYSVIEAFKMMDEGFSHSFRVNKHTAKFAIGPIARAIKIQLEQFGFTNFVVKNEVCECVFSEMSRYKDISKVYKDNYKVNPATYKDGALVYIMAENTTIEKLEECLNELKVHLYNDQEVVFRVLMPEDGKSWNDLKEDE